MKISAITQSEDNRRNMFIKYANSFMSMNKNNNAFEKAQNANQQILERKADKTMGIETLTIFPKEVINGKTTIIA